jgi:hypothetical protein
MAYGTRGSASSVLTEDTGRTIDETLQRIEGQGEPSRVTDDWTASPWDGVAPRKLTVRTGAGYVRIASLQVPGGGGAGGATKRTAYLCEVGQTTSAAKVQSEETAIADQINAIVESVQGGRLMLADSSGQIDLYVVPDAGTTASTLDLDVASV